MGQYDSWDYLTIFLKNHLEACLDRENIFSGIEEELSKPPFAVKVKHHPLRPNLVMFKYSQFESDFTNPIVRCCRGSVYNIKYEQNNITVKPYLLPFFKFMNFGEKGADPIDWNNKLYVRDKLDGSLLKLLKEEDGNDLWTTNGSFDIDVEVPELIPAQTEETIKPPYTFAKLRDYALKGHVEEIKNLPQGWTFMFELTSPYNRIIVPYKETKLFLLGCRDPKGIEHTPEWAAKEFHLTFETPLIYTLKNMEEVLSYCQTVDSDNIEGVVIQDANFNRIKIKTDHYRSLFYLKGDDHFSDTRIFEAIKQGSIDDAVAAWPEIRQRTEEITAEWISFRNAAGNLCKKGIEYFKACKEECADPKEAKKRYAMFVMGNHQPFSSFLFEAIKENADIEALFIKIDYKELKSHWLALI
ncbi:MAG: hypothetical protein FWB86_10345 [Treponema sp.]|nr:hypothetical protein [Treponema sp.]